MYNHLLCYGASVPGQKHIQTMRNNQDGYTIMRSNDFVIGVVCDGCTTTKGYSHNEVGARLFPAIIAKCILQRAIDNEEEILGVRFWDMVSQDIISKIGAIAQMIPGKTSDTIKEYLLFTIVGFVVWKDTVIVFHCGDGWYILNNQNISLSDPQRTVQSYIGYNLASIDDTSLLLSSKIQVAKSLPLSQVEHLVVASDGIADILKLDGKLIPLTKSPAGELEEFWKNPKFLISPHLAQNKLMAMNKRSFSVEYEKRDVTHFTELMDDDTTFIVLTHPQIPTNKWKSSQPMGNRLIWRRKSEVDKKR